VVLTKEQITATVSVPKRLNLLLDSIDCAIPIIYTHSVKTTSLSAVKASQKAPDFLALPAPKFKLPIDIFVALSN